VHHGPELAAIEPVRINTSIRSQSNLHAGLEGQRNIVFAAGMMIAAFFHDPGRKMQFGLVLFKPKEREGRGHQKCVCCFIQFDSFFVNKNSVFNGINAGSHRILDRNRRVRVGRHLRPSRCASAINAVISSGL